MTNFQSFRSRPSLPYSAPWPLRRSAIFITVLTVVIVTLVITITSTQTSNDDAASDTDDHSSPYQSSDWGHILTPMTERSTDPSVLRLRSRLKDPDPVAWLKQHSTSSSVFELETFDDESGFKLALPSIFKSRQDGRHTGQTNERRKTKRKHSGEGGTGKVPQRPRAALITLVRNEELDGIIQSMSQLEFHWNRRYGYPWIFFSETPFTEEFVAATSNATSSATHYETVPREHWSTPSWIDWDRYMDSLDYLGHVGVGKGWMQSYRHMCRWNSGFFYNHPALAEYDYYWRVEPDVHFFCDIPYDPFRFLHENDLVYGFNMNILDDARSFASLWRATREFVDAYPEMVHPEADLDWLIYSQAPHNTETADAGDSVHTHDAERHERGHDGEYDNLSILPPEYNNCQFFSNFEIASLNFFRSAANEAYFAYLDRNASGFYYERYGDAPVHTLSLALFAPKDKIWFFRDMGYQHDIARHCPPQGVASGLCTCEPTSIDENFYKLVPMESPQRKPDDTCIRLWLDGDWLEKKQGWKRDVERKLGGDGYGGYVNDGGT